MNALRAMAERFANLDQTTRLRGGIFIAACLALLLLLSAANDQVSRLTRKRAAREKDLAEMLSLQQRYLAAKAISQRLTNRLAATRPDDSPAKLIDEIGIKGKSSQIKPVQGEDHGGLVEDAAEVRIEGLTVNEMVNLLHHLEKGMKPVLIKKASIKTRFDDPSRVDLTMTIALLKGAPKGGR